MKDDLPKRPDKVPTKARQLEAMPDVWIAQWLAGDTLTPAERRRLDALRASRRSRRPDVPVGLLVGAEGATAPQLEAVADELRRAGPTEIHHPGNVPGRLHAACKRIGVPVIQHRDVRNAESGMREVVRLSGLVIAAPREMSEHATGSPVWNMIRHAKHRSVPVRIILPDGRLTGSESRSRHGRT